MKYYVIIIICVILFLLIRYENFDISANLNLFNDAYSPKLLNEKRIPMTMFPPNVDDNEVPNEVDFDNLSFGAVFTDHLLECDYTNGEWQKPIIKPTTSE